MSSLVIEKIILEIGDLFSHVVHSNSGSYYIHLKSSKVRYIRVANHTGHNPKRRTWQLRSDVSSSRSGTNRVYTNSGRLIQDLLEIT